MYKQPSRNGSSAQIINKMKDLSNVASVEVDSASEGQRVDNFLMRVCKGVPRSHIYRVLRTGEVRVNSRRVDATYRLQPGDKVRIPPLRTANRSAKAAPSASPLPPVVYEDDALLVIDKPSGLAVHGGSGVSFGVIEQFRAARPQLKFLELAHRLDRDTSGLLILAKKRSALTALHAALREGRVHKRYLALVPGKWREEERRVDLPLKKYLTKSGERRVSVHREGRESRTVFRRERRFRQTGRDRFGHGADGCTRRDLAAGSVRKGDVNLTHVTVRSAFALCDSVSASARQPSQACLAEACLRAAAFHARRRGEGW